MLRDGRSRQRQTLDTYPLIKVLFQGRFSVCDLTPRRANAIVILNESQIYVPFIHISAIQSYKIPFTLVKSKVRAISVIPMRTIPT